MRAAVLEGGKLSVGELAEPVPIKGQVLVRTRRCALCASDAHFLCSGEEIVRSSRETGGPYAGVDLSKPIVMGHEFVGEIVDYGPGSRMPLKIGTRVTSIPVMLKGADGFGIVGYSSGLPGGFGEYMLLDEDMMLEVTDDLDDDMAALIEPLAVGLEHARVGEAQTGDIAVVIGCGAIGLGVIAGLRLAGIGPIIASDLDAGRRALALKMGADIALDPRGASPYAPQSDLGGKQANLIYECVGKPGLLNMIVNGVGPGARIIMGGFCMEPEQFSVATAQTKRLKINFACGEEPQDMELALRAIGDGRIDVTSWIGGHIGLGDVGAALAAMSDPASPVRTLVDPRRG